MSDKNFYRDVKLGELLTLLARDYPNNEALVYPDYLSHHSNKYYLRPGSDNAKGLNEDVEQQENKGEKENLDREAIDNQGAKSKGLRYTFGELESVVCQVARGLMAIGIGKGERVALWATNEPEWVILQFALAKIGAILVTVNTSFRAPELEYLLKQSQACTLITVAAFKDTDYLEIIDQVVPDLKDFDGMELFHTANLPYLRYAILLDTQTKSGFLNFSRLLELAYHVSEAELKLREESLHLDDVINMQYTSGTTGFPKGVMLTHSNIVNNGYWLGEAMALTSADKLCLPVPLFHCFGCVIGVMGAYTHAVCLVPLEYFDAHRVLRLVAQERCTALYGVPTMFIAELEEPNFAQYDLTTLRTGIMAGALCPEPLMRRVIDEMHLTEMLIAYGMTESSPGITHTLRDDTIERRTQTVGKVMPAMSVKIIDPISLAEVDTNTPGELCVRGYNVMKGYYNNESATKEALITLDGEEGWLRTGDQATIDEVGYVRITGRIKEIIIRGGENISPKEVEDLLRQHEKIADVYVYSLPSEKFGEEVAVAIRLKPDLECSEAEILAFCCDKISRFKIPRYLRFVTSFPVTASGKVQRFKLREMHVAELKVEEQQ